MAGDASLDKVKDEGADRSLMLTAMVCLMASDAIESGRLSEDGCEAWGVDGGSRGLKGREEGRRGGRKNTDCLPSA